MGAQSAKKHIISPRLSTNLAPPLTQRSFNPRRLPELSTGSEDDQAHALKRPRLVWTPPLHQRFVDAVSHLGVTHIDMPCTAERVWQAIQAAQA